MAHLFDEIKEKQDELSGVEQTSFAEDEHNILEMHVDLDLPGFEDMGPNNKKTGIMVPYLLP